VYDRKNALIAADLSIEDIGHTKTKAKSLRLMVFVSVLTAPSRTVHWKNCKKTWITGLSFITMKDRTVDVIAWQNTHANFHGQQRM